MKKSGVSECISGTKRAHISESQSKTMLITFFNFEGTFHFESIA
jgi:hypothetical protein